MRTSDSKLLLLSLCISSGVSSGIFKCITYGQNTYTSIKSGFPLIHICNMKIKGDTQIMGSEGTFKDGKNICLSIAIHPYNGKLCITEIYGGKNNIETIFKQLHLCMNVYLEKYDSFSIELILDSQDERLLSSLANLVHKLNYYTSEGKNIEIVWSPKFRFSYDALLQLGEQLKTTCHFPFRIIKNLQTMMGEQKVYLSTTSNYPSLQ